MVVHRGVITCKLLLLVVIGCILTKNGRGEMLARCLPGYVHRGGTGDCYLFHDRSTRTWDDADAYCIRQQGHLVIIGSKEMTEWLALQIVETGLVGDSSDFWIDARYNDTTSTWYWDHGGNNVNLDSIPEDEIKDGNYGTLTTSSTLRGHPESDQYHFICQRDIEKPLLCDFEDGWHMWYQHCYAGHESAASWPSAVVECREKGGTLMTVNGGQENQYVKDHAMTYHDNIWIGMTEVNHPNHWFWVGDNSSSYTNWNTNDSMPVSQGGYGSAVVDEEGDSGLWMTEISTNSHHYICEKEQDACVMGWELFGDSCYYFNAMDSDEVSWESAYDFCNLVGAELIVIETEEEDDFIHDRINEQDQMWIGLFYNQTSTQFVWVDGVEYSHDNFTRMTQESEDSVSGSKEMMCVFTQMLEAGTSQETMNWQPVLCQEPHKYICEVLKGKPVNMIIPDVDQFCPEGWKLENDFCYYGSEEEVSWTSAEAKCKQDGGHLASVNSWMENDSIRNLIAADSWIGLNDRSENDNYVWTDGHPLIFENFNTDEPSGGDENCIEMLLDNGLWNDLTCSSLSAFVCRRPASDTPITPQTTTTTAPETQACGQDWVEDTSSGTCYRVVQEKLAFQDARLHCSDLDHDGGTGDLVSLSTPQEQLFVQSLVSVAQLEDPAVFIGLRNSFSLGMHWTDDSPVTFFNYADGEPNSPSSEECSEIINDGVYQWNDIGCTERKPFVCEKKGSNYVPPTLAPGLAVQCPSNWVYFNQYCYYVSPNNDLVNWDTASTSCQSLYGSSFISILNEDENSFLRDIILEGDEHVWIGLRAANDTGTFEWVDDSPFEFSNWYPGQPDNLNGNEPCAEMMVSYDYNGVTGIGEWNDRKCDYSNRFACKMPFKTCPQSWNFWNDKCYYISDEYQTWNISMDHCKQVVGEATLLSVHSQEEMDHVQEITDDAVDGFWVGLYHLNQDDPWKWVDGTETDYVNWRPGQPNKNDTELCALAESGQDVEGLLDDYPCDSSFNYACEYTPTHFVGCDDGWLFYNNWCFYSSAAHNLSDTKTFEDAQTQCHEWSSELASIHTREENEFLGSTLNQYYDYDGWVGLTDKDTEGLLKWTDNSVVSYTNLAVDPGFDNSPMCFGMSSMNSASYPWWSRDCSLQSFYFCKKAPIVVPIGPPSSGCEMYDDLYHEGSCYRAVHQLEVYDVARDNCSAIVDGGHLVTIQDQRESAYLAAYTSLLSSRSWIGLEKVANDDGSIEFKWIDGSDFTFSNWGKFEPTEAVDMCITESGESDTAGLWYTTNCGEKLPYFCEYEREGYTSVAPPVTTLGPAYCAPGWNYNRDTASCYKLMTEIGHTQGLAESECVLFGGHLVSITSEAEERFIKSMPVWENFSYTTFWTGLVLTDEEGYAWLDGSPTDLIHWANGQPDSHLEREECVTAYKESLALSDTYCDGIFAYMCEAPQGMPASTLPPLTNSPDVPCPGSDGESGWLLYNDHCYKVFSLSAAEIPQSWGGARLMCQQQGAELLSVLDKEENSFVLSKVYLYPDYQLWTGAQADYDGGFHWSDGEPFNFVNWQIGEPNNYLDQESCVALYPHSQAYWNDENCGNAWGWVCKKPSGSTLPPPATTSTPQGHCPEGWIHAVGKCLKLNRNQLVFDEARTYCKDAGINSDLLSIHSPSQQAVLNALVLPLKEPAWIGLRSNRGFVWVDQSPMDYSNWSPGEPDNNEECVSAVSTDGTWNDINCDTKISSVCMQNIHPELSTDSPSPTCSEPFQDFFNYSGSCYKAILDAKTWQASEEFCQEQQAHLASIEGIGDNSFLYSFADQLALSDFWIGFNSLKSPDQYLWSDNYPVLYSNWGNDEPNVTDTSARCVQLSTTDAGLWFSKSCDETKPFFCKHSEGSVPTPEPPVDGRCPTTHWLDFGGGYCYLVEGKDEKEWNDANQECIQQGGFLVSIHSREEMDLIIKATSSYSNTLWTGLIQQTNDFGWSDGTAFDFTDWAEGEPNDVDEPCVEMYGYDRLWNDAKCDVEKGYVCKAAKVSDVLPSSTTPPPPVTISTTPNPGGRKGLTGGGITGIVIGCLLLVVTAVLVTQSYRKRYAARAARLALPRRDTGFANAIVDPPDANFGDDRTRISVVDMDGYGSFDNSHTTA